MQPVLRLNPPVCRPRQRKASSSHGCPFVLLPDIEGLVHYRLYSVIGVQPRKQFIDHFITAHFSENCSCGLKGLFHIVCDFRSNWKQQYKLPTKHCDQQPFADAIQLNQKACLSSLSAPLSPSSRIWDIELARPGRSGKISASNYRAQDHDVSEDSTVETFSISRMKTCLPAYDCRMLCFVQKISRSLRRACYLQCSALYLFSIL